MERGIEAGLADAVLERLALDRPKADTDGLRAVYRAWCDHIPFDNLQKLVALRQDRKPLPGDDAEEFFRNWLSDGTGATCWASSNALYHLLVHLGFDVVRLTAAMLDLPDPNHGTNLVTVDGSSYLADSSVLSGEPIEAGGDRTMVDSSHYLVELRPEGDAWLMTFPSAMFERMVCRVFAEPADAGTYQRLHERTRELSVFNDHLHVTRHLDGSVWNLRHRTLTELCPAGQQVEMNDDDTRNWLARAGFSERAVDAAIAAER